MITGFVPINAPLIVLLLDHTIEKTSYNLNAYLFVFNILIIISIASLIFSVFFIKETFCKSAVNFTFLTPERAL